MYSVLHTLSETETNENPPQNEVGMDRHNKLNLNHTGRCIAMFEPEPDISPWTYFPEHSPGQFHYIKRSTVFKGRSIRVRSTSQCPFLWSSYDDVDDSLIVIWTCYLLTCFFDLLLDLCVYVFGKLLIPVFSNSLACTCRLESLLEASRSVWLDRWWYKRVDLSTVLPLSCWVAVWAQCKCCCYVAYRILYWV